MGKYTQQTNDQFLSKIKGIFVLKKKRFNYNRRLLTFLLKFFVFIYKRIFSLPQNSSVFGHRHKTNQSQIESKAAMKNKKLEPAAELGQISEKFETGVRTIDANKFDFGFAENKTFR